MNDTFYIEGGKDAETGKLRVRIFGFIKENSPLLRWDSLYPHVSEIGRVFSLKFAGDHLIIKGDQAIHMAFESEEGVGYAPKIFPAVGTFRPITFEQFNELRPALGQLAKELAQNSSAATEFMKKFGL